VSILLIGYRGSGKTTLGSALAARLGWSFVDLDQRISQAAGMTIREIFQRHGQPHFRDLETLHLLQSLKLKNHVIALGGGAVLAKANQKAIAEARHPVVYLKAAAQELHRRILADPVTAQQRPSLTHLGGNVDEIRALLAEREPIYLSVKTVELNVQGKAIDELVDELIGLIPLAPPGPLSR
jgi:shikimate kinase